MDCDYLLQLVSSPAVCSQCPNSSTRHVVRYSIVLLLGAKGIGRHLDLVLLLVLVLVLVLELVLVLVLVLVRSLMLLLAVLILLLLLLLSLLLLLFLLMHVQWCLRQPLLLQLITAAHLTTHVCGLMTMTVSVAFLASPPA